MYTDLAEWWPLLSAPSEYREEAEIFARALADNTAREIRDVLELGCGGGNNASHLKRRFAMTLVDVSSDMLAVSRALNPGCAHVLGDMRSVRLERDFDAVFVHDAVMYMTTEPDLDAAIRTAAIHLRSGGVALFVPDETTETFRPHPHEGGHERDGRAIRYLQLPHPFEPGSTMTRTSYTYWIRENDTERVEQEDHVCGLFPRAAWLRLIADAGLEARAIPYRHSTFHADDRHEMFVGVKP